LPSSESRHAGEPLFRDGRAEIEIEGLAVGQVDHVDFAHADQQHALPRGLQALARQRRKREHALWFSIRAVQGEHGIREWGSEPLVPPGIEGDERAVHRDGEDAHLTEPLTIGAALDPAEHLPRGVALQERLALGAPARSGLGRRGGRTLTRFRGELPRAHRAERGVSG
jgi:hypothetical protein